MSNYKHLQSKLAKRHKGLFHRVENTACLKHLNRWLISPVIIKCKVKKKKKNNSEKATYYTIPSMWDSGKVWRQ